MFSVGLAHQFLNNRQPEHLGRFGGQGGTGPESLEFTPKK
jgi:hypothetical protein